MDVGYVTIIRIIRNNIVEKKRKGGKMNLDRDNIKKIRGLIVFTILVLVALWNYVILLKIVGFLWNVITPFVIGGAIAFILNVPMSFIEKKVFKETKLDQKKIGQKLSRPVSFILAVLFVIGLIAIVVFVVVPELGRTIVNLGKTVQEFLPEAQKWAIQFFGDNPEIVTLIQSIEFEWDKILGEVVNFLKNGAGSVLGTTFEAAKSIMSAVSTFLIAFVFSCYILLQKEKLSVQVRKLMYAFMPRDWTEIFIALGSVSYKTFSSFLTGQCVEAVILGLMFFVSMTIFRMPYAVLIAVLIAFTALIPIFGALIGCAVGALLIFMVNPMQAAGFVIMFLILQQIEGNFIYPYVVGNSVGLPSMWVLAAVSVGASLMGVVGMLIFIPIVSVIYTILRGIVNRRLKEKNITVE